MKKMTAIHSLVSVQFKKKRGGGGYTMLKVTLSDYTVIYVKTMGEALEKAFKLGQNIRFID